MTRRASEQGMALAIVLAGLVILAMISMALLTHADRDVTKANAEVERAKSVALVEGVVDASILALFAPDARLRLIKSGGEFTTTIADTKITARARGICGLWDLNHGKMEVFIRLLEQLGAPSPTLIAEALSVARRVELGLLSREQLRALPGVDVELYRRLSKEVTVHCRADRIDPGFASPTLLSAIPGLSRDRIETLIDRRRSVGTAPDIQVTHAEYLAPGPGQTHELIASHALGPGSRVYRRVVVTLTHRPSEPYRVLVWSTTE